MTKPGASQSTNPERHRGNIMQTSISIGSAYYNGEDWDQLVEYTMAADHA